MELKILNTAIPGEIETSSMKEIDKKLRSDLNTILLTLEQMTEGYFGESGALDEFIRRGYTEEIGTSLQTVIPMIHKMFDLIEEGAVKRNLALELLLRQVDEERRKSDRLLLNILPEYVAEELKATNTTIPRYHDLVTVLFTDMKGFTKMAERMSPEELVRELESCFEEFDNISARYGLERIKTIGDSYMCAGGLQSDGLEKVKNCVRAGLEFQQFMKLAKEEKTRAGRDYWEARIGIHTGPVVAGVIGKTKFAYDIWGDTVNIASRCESNGSPGRVNISRATHDLVKNTFNCESRGIVEIKNRSPIEMWFVLNEKKKI
ncbi:MAG: adenylate/guanylate cyclase domain-containing protein [Candidatus Wallbacteria bacterium]|nr:adenylate/guanylate cyclase domain-containing protein [Candidatus Wallbacteria bacterium]